MKTVILYATKRGTTHDVAVRIAGALADAGIDTVPEILDLKVIEGLPEKLPDLEACDCVILGSAVYAGQIRKEMRSFLLPLSLPENRAKLEGKRFGIYLCGLDVAKEEEAFSTNFPTELLDMAKAKAFLGGAFDPKTANFVERTIIKAVTKTSDSVDTVDEEKIAQFVQELMV